MIERYALESVSFYYFYEDSKKGDIYQCDIFFNCLLNEIFLNETSQGGGFNNSLVVPMNLSLASEIEDLILHDRHELQGLALTDDWNLPPNRWIVDVGLRDTSVDIDDSLDDLLVDRANESEEVYLDTQAYYQLMSGLSADNLWDDQSIVTGLRHDLYYLAKSSSLITIFSLITSYLHDYVVSQGIEGSLFDRHLTIHL